MKRKKRGSYPGIQIGTSYLLVIFVILCLVTFATLSLSSAKRDQSYSQQLAGRETAYCEANAKAAQIMAQIDDAFAKEDRVEVTFSDFYRIMRESTKAELLMNAVKCNVPHRYIREMETGKSEDTGQS